MTRILLYDSTSAFPSNPLFAEALEEMALERSDIEWSFFDEAPYREVTRLWQRAYHRLRHAPPQVGQLNRAFTDRVRDFRPDVTLIVKGDLLRPKTLMQAKRGGTVLANFGTDDPFNSRVSAPWARDALGLYDIYFSPRRAVMEDLRSYVGQVVYLPFGYKPAVHFPEPHVSEAERAAYGCDVSFVGGADAERLPYFRRLLADIPRLDLRLYGGYWDHDPALRACSRGLVQGRDFRLAVACSRISVNLVRRANRDGHVMRTFELPACGAFVLGERTAEHQDFFREDEDLAMFSGPEEMSLKVSQYLSRESDRDVMAQAGHATVTGGCHTYADRLAQMLSKVGELT